MFWDAQSQPVDRLFADPQVVRIGHYGEKEEDDDELYRSSLYDAFQRKETASFASIHFALLRRGYHILLELLEIQLLRLSSLMMAITCLK